MKAYQESQDDLLWYSYGVQLPFFDADENPIQPIIGVHQKH